jgi:hypothetical protein
VVTIKYPNKLLDVLEIPVSKLKKSLFVILVVPSSCDRFFYADTRLGIFGLETLVDTLELFFSGLQSVAGVPILFGSVRGIFFLLEFKDGLFFL